MDGCEHCARYRIEAEEIAALKKELAVWQKAFPYYKYDGNWIVGCGQLPPEVEEALKGKFISADIKSAVKGMFGAK